MSYLSNRLPAEYKPYETERSTMEVYSWFSLSLSSILGLNLDKLTAKCKVWHKEEETRMSRKYIFI
jgi:hypothetical protein